VVIGDLAQSTTGGIAVTNTAVGTVTVFADLGSGLFASAIEPGAGTSPDAILAGNFSNSAFPDVVVTNNIANAAGQVTLIESPASLISNPAISQTPYPGSEYEDIGIRSKPRRNCTTPKRSRCSSNLRLNLFREATSTAFR